MPKLIERRDGVIVLREVSFLECKEVGGRYNESTKECLIERERVDYPLNTKEAELIIKRYESKGEKAKLEWMSPTRFLASVPHPHTTELPAYWSSEKDYDKSSLKRVALAYLKGREMEPLLLDYTAMWYGYPTHEGRHRAFVAKELGVEEIPVVVVER